MGAQQPEYGIAAVTRTAALVAAMMRLGSSPLTRLAAEAGCTAPNAFRILQTLSALGLAAQHGSRGPWQLGAGWLAVARAAVQQGAIPFAAGPVLSAFATSCGETVSFVMRDGEQCEVVAVQPSSAATRPYAALGERGPLHAGPGRLLLAYAPDPVQRAVLASRLPRLGSATRTDAAWIAADLPRIRARDWLITTDEIADGAVTVSTAVRNEAADVIGALSIVSPALRMRPPRPHTLLTPLTAAATSLGVALGCAGLCGLAAPCQ